jgi:hypothetical protein
VTIANAPLSGTGCEEYGSDLGQAASKNSEKQKYFCKRDWTGQISLIRLNKFGEIRFAG